MYQFYDVVSIGHGHLAYKSGNADEQNSFVWVSRHLLKGAQSAFGASFLCEVSFVFLIPTTANIS